MNLHAVRLWARSCFMAREHQEETITKSSVLKTKDRANLQTAKYYDNNEKNFIDNNAKY